MVSLLGEVVIPRAEGSYPGVIPGFGGITKLQAGFRDYWRYQTERRILVLWASRAFKNPSLSLVGAKAESRLYANTHNKCMNRQILKISLKLSHWSFVPRDELEQILFIKLNNLQRCWLKCERGLPDSSIAYGIRLGIFLISLRREPGITSK